MGHRSKIKLSLSTVVWFLLLLLIVLNVFTIAIILNQQHDLKREMNHMMEQAITNIPEPKDGYTPIKGKDYFDGTSVTDTQIEQAVSTYLKNNPPPAGKDGYTPVKGKDYFDGKPGKDGSTKVIVCNTEKNYWVVRYSPEELWQLLNGKRTECNENS